MSILFYYYMYALEEYISYFYIVYLLYTKYICSVNKIIVYQCTPAVAAAPAQLGLQGHGAQRAPPGLRRSEKEGCHRPPEPSRSIN